MCFGTSESQQGVSDPVERDVRSVPMIAGGVAYILGLGAILVGVVAGVKGCSVEQEPSKPKLIKKAKLFPVVDNQQQLIR